MNFLIHDFCAGLPGCWLALIDPIRGNRSAIKTSEHDPPKLRQTNRLTSYRQAAVGWTLAGVGYKSGTPRIKMDRRDSRRAERARHRNMKTNAHKYFIRDLITGTSAAGLALATAAMLADTTQWRHAYVTDVYDGDTATAVVDLGFDVQSTQHFRLLHVDTPEMRVPGMDGINPAGQRAKDFTVSQILEKEVLLHETKPDKYGRWLAEIRTPDGRDLAKELIRRKLGVPYEGGKRGEEP